ncbi:MAG: ribosomal RNA small subunit methyltransferase A [Acidobacteriota bacterium]|nr:MAG: ribosomal RNA small subunit methyltransferase A [Acidobacteriota bacterium]
MKAKRHLGQNFLVGTHYPDRILKAVSPAAGETIVEIGPGRGALTRGLIESGARIIAIELDADLIPLLRERFAAFPDFRLVEADALKVDFCQLISPAGSARVVANLPYNVSTPVLQRLLDHRRCLSELTLMLQREVVDRITAPPGGREYGYLSVLVGMYSETERLFDVPPGAFRPAPKVHSSVIRLKVLPKPAADVADEEVFSELTKCLFAQRRKTILNNLRAASVRLGLTADAGRLTELAGIDPRRRAETLSIAEIARLTNVLLETRQKKETVPIG